MSETLYCPCETDGSIQPQTIQAGLDYLPRQRGYFSDFKQSLLYYSRLTPSGGFKDWSADDPADLGHILMDGWAYLLDILSFYDREVSQNSYLKTANAPGCAEEITDLLGYIPRPASAASAKVALYADGNDPVLIKAGTGLKTDSFDDEVPQIFEVDADTAIYPQVNTLTLDKIRTSTLGTELWVSASDNSVVKGDNIVLKKDDILEAFTVVDGKRKRAADGGRYIRLDLDPALPATLIGTPLSDIKLLKFSRRISTSLHTPADSGAAQTGDGNVLNLDGRYPELREGARLLIEDNGSFITGKVTNSNLIWMKVTDDDDVTIPIKVVDGTGTVTDEEVTLRVAKFPVTQIRYEGNPISGLKKDVKIYVSPYRAARLLNPAKNHIPSSDLSEYQDLSERLVEFLDPDIPPLSAIIRGRKKRAAFAPISYDIDVEKEDSRLKITNTSTLPDTLRVPIRFHGNVVDVSRGETVEAEILGSSDGFTVFQEYKLKKTPLTYLLDKMGSNKLLPVIEVRVNGVRWKRVDSLLGFDPGDNVYQVRTRYDGESYVIFGDQAVPPSGVDNISASYRFGAGAAKPPFGAINGIANKVDGLGAVLWSLEATGGSDADKAEDIKENAPCTVLCLGRAVSLSDYEAIARQYPGVINAFAGWNFDEKTLRSQVVIWVISDGGSVAVELGDHLRQLGDPQTPVMVNEALALETAFNLTVQVDPDYLAEEVLSRLRIVLFDAETGLLAPRNQRAGLGIYRSALVTEILNVEGIIAVVSLTMGLDASAPGLVAPEGQYFAFSQDNVEAAS